MGSGKAGRLEGRVSVYNIYPVKARQGVWENLILEVCRVFVNASEITGNGLDCPLLGRAAFPKSLPKFHWLTRDEAKIKKHHSDQRKPQ